MDGDAYDAQPPSVAWDESLISYRAAAAEPLTAPNLGAPRHAASRLQASTN